jgi:hypothetical protein
MTLIAAFQPGGKYLTLMSDVLISSPEQADFILPTRGYVSPEQARAMPMRPKALGRKVIQINPKFVILWSGAYGRAVKLAKYAREWFSGSDINKISIIQFLGIYDKELEGISAFFAWYGGFAGFGPSTSGKTKHYGKYVAGGSGQTSKNEQLSAGEHPRNQLLRSIDSTRIFESITPAGRRLAGLK